MDSKMTSLHQLCDGDQQETEEMNCYKNGTSEKKWGNDTKEKRDDTSTTDMTNGLMSPKFSVVPCFVANITCMLILVMTMTIYNVGVVRTLERRFGLQSSQTGLVMAMNDVSHIIVVVFIGYLGRKAHKPKIMSITVLFSALAGVMMAIPHFVFLKMNPTSIPLNATEDADKHLCVSSDIHPGGLDSNRSDCDSSKPHTPVSDSAGHHAYLVFLAAQFMDGIGGSGLTTLGIAYIDENSSKAKASLYVGIVMGCYAFGPIVGFLLSALCLRLPESPLNPASTDPSDPDFIGAWWLGYFICAAGILISAIPMWFFPKHVLPPKNIREESIADRDLSKLGSIKKEFRDFLPSLLQMVSNKAYMVMQAAIILTVYIVYGIYMNMPRYIEVHFRRPAFVASIVVAINTAFAGVIGGFLGGAIMSRMKLTPPGGVRLILFSLFVGCLGIVISIALACPQVKMAGDWNHVDNMLSVDLPTCNDECDCFTDEDTYRPICGSDNLTYFSPCHAGCKHDVNGTFSACECLGREGSAREGVCNEPCNLLIPYAVSLFVASLLSSVGRVPTTIVQLRIVEEDMRSFALGLSSFAVNLIGYIPGPVLFGAIIDSTCILWQKTCEKTGACLLYDVTRFRLLTHGISLAFLFGGLLLTVVLYVIMRKMEFSDQESENNKDKMSRIVSSQEVQVLLEEPEKV